MQRLHGAKNRIKESEFCRKLSACADHKQAVRVFGRFVSEFVDYEKISFYFFEFQKQIINFSLEIDKTAKVIENASRCYLSPADIDKIFNIRHIKIISAKNTDLPCDLKTEIDFIIPLTVFGEKIGFAVVFGVKNNYCELKTKEKEKLIQTAYLFSCCLSNLNKSLMLVHKDNLIKETKEYVSNILENMVHGVISIDSKGIVTTFSKGAEILLELDSKDVVYRNYMSVFPEEICRLIDEIKVRLLSEKYIVESEVEYIMQGKFLIPIKFTASLLKDKNEQENGLILVCKDSSSVKRLIALQELRNLRSEFLATASHEFKTPLNLIMGSVGILGDGMVGDMNDQQKRLVGLVKEGGSRLHKLIKDLLDFSRIEKEQVHTNENVNLCNVLDECLTILNESARAKNISIVKSISDRDLSICASHGKVIKIFDNLISNAIKYTPEEGKIYIQIRLIRTEKFPESFYRFSGNSRLRVVENAAEIVIEDTGIGISRDNFELIFQQFKRVDDPYVRKNEGTGLGLSITRKIVESLGGSISVESERGKGSKFVVLLPIF